MEREWLTRLLAADPEELRGEGEGDLARLVRSHAEVQAVANSILREQAKLSDTLSALALQPGETAVAEQSARSNRVHRNARALQTAGRWTMVSLGAAALVVLFFARFATPPHLRPETQNSSRCGSMRNPTGPLP